MKPDINKLLPIISSNQLPVHLPNSLVSRGLNDLSQRAGKVLPQYSDAKKLYDDKQYAKAFEMAKELALNGDLGAMNILGRMYKYGQGVEQDYVEAMKWYRLAAERGDTAAQWVLGVMYENGQGVEQDYVEAMKWHHLAAEQGDAITQIFSYKAIGTYYNEGQGVVQNKEEAAKWFLLAAKCIVREMRAHSLTLREQRIVALYMRRGFFVEENEEEWNIFLNVFKNLRPEFGRFIRNPVGNKSLAPFVENYLNDSTQ